MLEKRHVDSNARKDLLEKISEQNNTDDKQ